MSEDRKLTWSQFEAVDMRVGTILSASPNTHAHKPAYVLEIDFGPLGIRRSSAQLTDHYTIEDLVEKRIVAVVNFPPKQIAHVMSECLVLGSLDADGKVRLLAADADACNGDKIA